MYAVPETVCRKEQTISTNLYDKDLYFKVNNELTEGLVLKNYKELCKTLELPIVGGKSKQLQIKNLERFCKLEQDGHKYIVTEIFDSPYEKEDKRVNGNHAIFVTYIESILLNYFINQGKIRCNFTKRELWETLGMVSENYSTNYEKKSFLYSIQSVDDRVRQWHIDRFYARSRKKLNDITKTALNSLKNRKLIEWSEVIVARKDGNYFEVTKSWQIEKILECEREALLELGCRNIKEVIFNSNKNVNMKSYIDLRNKKLQKTLEFDFIFRRYSVICNRKYLEQGLQENEQELKNFLNNKIIDSVNNQAQKEFDKNRADLKSGKTHFIFPNYYVDIQKLLATKLLNINEQLIEEFIDTIQLDAELEELFA